MYASRDHYRWVAHTSRVPFVVTVEAKNEEEARNIANKTIAARPGSDYIRKVWAKEGKPIRKVS